MPVSASGRFVGICDFENSTHGEMKINDHLCIVVACSHDKYGVKCRGGEHEIDSMHLLLLSVGAACWWM